MITLNDQNYKKILEKGRFVIDVWQDGCEPCKMYGPLFRACEQSFDGVKFAQFKVNRQGSSEFRREFLTFAKDEFAGSPTTILVEDGKMIRRYCGYMNAIFLEEFITTGVPKEFEKYEKKDLEALGFQTIKAIEAFEALKQDSIMLMDKIHGAIGTIESELPEAVSSEK